MNKNEEVYGLLKGMNEIAEIISNSAINMIRELTYEKVCIYLESTLYLKGPPSKVHELIALYLEIISANLLNDFIADREFTKYIDSHPDFKKMTVSGAIISLIRQAFLDIYGLQILGIQNGMKSGVLKKVLYQNMIYGNRNNNQTIIGTIMQYKSNTSYENLTNGFGNNTKKNPACPFFVSDIRTQWIDIIWNIVKDELIPQIQEFYTSSQNADERFYSGNTIKRPF